MSNNYNINLNPKEPSSKEIAKHKNFDALLARYRTGAKPMSALRVIYSWGAAAAAIAALIFFIGFFGMERTSINEEEYFAAQPFVNPPLEEFQPAFTNFRVEVNQGAVLEYESGSRLVVPAAAFMDDRGRLIEGAVEIRYREMHDYVDFFLAGVPMVYDSAGVRYNLESAGMIEIYAEKDGQRVNLAPGVEIQVELISEVILPNIYETPKYNIYRLDTAARNWVYQDVDRIQILEDEVLDENDPLYPMKKELLDNISEIESSVQNELEYIESTIPKPEEPLRPQRKHGDNPSLELDFLDEAVVYGDGDENSELAAQRQMYKGTVWQISPLSPAYSDEDLNQVWESMHLRKLNSRVYELTLFNDGKTIKLLVNPVLTGRDYEKALEQFESEYAAYEQAMAERETRLSEQKQALMQKLDAEKAAAQRAFVERLAALRERGLEYAATQEIIKRKVINRFKATDFGIWNCDRPLPPFVHTVKGSFVDQKGNRLDNRVAYLVDKSRNTVYRFLASKNAQINFNANSENILWLVTEDNKIAIFRPEDFRRLNQRKNDHTFVMTVADREIRSEKDVREILEF